MAKKSAKSKGYRKTAAQKSYITKKELTVTIIVAAVVILALALFIGLYDDGSLKVSGGAVQADGENNLIVNAGTGYEPRYFKLGQLADIDGYTLAASPISSDGNVNEFIYTPDGESPVDSISVRTYALDADTYAKGAEDTYTSDPTMNCDGLHTTEDDGHAVSYLTFRVTPSDTTTDPDNILTTAVNELLAEAEADGEVDPEATVDPDEQALLELMEAAEEAEETMLVQALHGYVNAGENRLIYVLVRNDVESVDEYVDDSALVDAFNQTLAALSYETK